MGYALIKFVNWKDFIDTNSATVKYFAVMLQHFCHAVWEYILESTDKFIE